jgi:hypothetical protein
MEIDELFDAALKSVESTKNDDAVKVPLTENLRSAKTSKTNFDSGIKSDLINLLTKYKYDVNNKDLQFVIASFLQQISNF